MKSADIVYTDCWPTRLTDTARQEIERQFAPFQVAAEILTTASSQAAFLPCPPVTRGEEVSDDRNGISRMLGRILGKDRHA